MDQNARRRAVTLGMIRQRYQIPRERIQQIDERLKTLAASTAGATSHHRLFQIFQARTLRENEHPDEALRFVELAIEMNWIINHQRTAFD